MRKKEIRNYLDHGFEERQRVRDQRRADKNQKVKEWKIREAALKQGILDREEINKISRQRHFISGHS